MYTSPPFGVVSPRLTTSEDLEDKASHTLGDAAIGGADHRSAFDAYQEVTLGMMRQAVRHLSHATLIIEHEPADDGHDARGELVSRIGDEFGDAVHDIRVLESAAFSWRGVLSFIVCELQA